MDIFIIIAGFAVSAFTAFSFYKAGMFKATSSKEALLQAGFGWIEKIPFGLVRLIAWLEILGAAGVVIAPIGYLLGLEWAIWFAIAAAVGLALTMVGAIWVHAARGETKYTLKMNLNLLVASLVTGATWLLLTLV